jgi:sirohydrochlorin cobaltochelatase
MTQALILFAHGSRDAQWRQPIEAVAARVRALSPGLRVACAYLELTEPSLMQCATNLIAAGADNISVRPLFLGVGKHAREDLPLLMQQLREQHAQVQFSLHAPVGEEAAVIDALAQVALQAL